MSSSWIPGDTFGSWMRRCREELGYTQRTLSASLEIDFSYISKWENNRLDFSPTEALLEDVATQLELNPLEVVCRSGRLREVDKKRLLTLAVLFPYEFVELIDLLDESPWLIKKALQAIKDG